MTRIYNREDELEQDSIDEALEQSREEREGRT